MFWHCSKRISIISTIYKIYFCRICIFIFLFIFFSPFVCRIPSVLSGLKSFSSGERPQPGPDQVDCQFQYTTMKNLCQLFSIFYDSFDDLYRISYYCLCIPPICLDGWRIYLTDCYNYENAIYNIVFSLKWKIPYRISFCPVCYYRREIWMMPHTTIGALLSDILSLTPEKRKMLDVDGISGLPLLTVQESNIKKAWAYRCVGTFTLRLSISEVHSIYVQHSTWPGGCCTADVQRLCPVFQVTLGNVAVTSLRGQRSNQERPFKGAIHCAT